MPKVLNCHGQLLTLDAGADPGTYTVPALDTQIWMEILSPNRYLTQQLQQQTHL